MAHVTAAAVAATTAAAAAAVAVAAADRGQVAVERHGLSIRHGRGRHSIVVGPLVERRKLELHNRS